MKIDTLALHLSPSSCSWEIRRADRLKLEQKFLRFTGHMDVIEAHIPYTRYVYLTECMRKAQNIKGNKILVFAGDSMNLDMFSRFYPKSSEKSSPKKEWEDLLMVLRMAEDVYDDIIFMETNHDNRIWKFVRDKILSPEQLNEIKDWMYTYKEAFEREDFTKITTVKGAIFQIGDVLITHFENNSIVPGVVPRDVIKYLTPRMKKHWNIVFQAHTHSQSKISNDRKIAIEIGALCKTLDYWRSGKMKGKGKLSSLGYGVCDMVNGKADPNSADFVFCEWEGYL